jgi:hypothetical protein
VDYFDYFYAKMVTWENLFMFSNAGFLLSRALCNLLPIRILINRLKKACPINPKK